MSAEETFPAGTVYNRVMEQLEEFVKEWRNMGEEEEYDEGDLQRLVDQVSTAEDEEGGEEG